MSFRFEKNVKKKKHCKRRRQRRIISRAAAAGGGKDSSNGEGGDPNKRHRADPNAKLDGTAAAAAGGDKNSRGRRGGVRQREREERKRERADSRDSREPPAGGRNPKQRGKEGRVGGASGKDSFAGGAGGPPFRDLENWDPEKALIRSMFLTDDLDKVIFFFLINPFFFCVRRPRELQPDDPHCPLSYGTYCVVRIWLNSRFGLSFFQTTSRS